MTDPHQILDDIRIASPCNANWNEMTGDDRTRFCGECNRDVFNISEMSPVEAAELIERASGRLCVRLYRRKDGTVLTRDCPVGFRAAVGRATRAAGAALVAVLGLFSGGVAMAWGGKAQEEGQRCEKPSDEPRVKMGKIALPRVQVLTVSVRNNGVPLDGAQVVLTNLGTGEASMITQDENGLYRFENVEPGIYSVVAVAHDLEPSKPKTVRITRGSSIEVDIELGEEELMIMGEIALPEPPEGEVPETPEP